MIVGTAGHVDHGKTSLVRALTGFDTDRLAEEKSRGISIELGFAYARLDGHAAGEPIGFVDVPGHRDFVQTMIAGAAGIDLGLLVVAADDGPMPQTCEHVAILRWLGVTRLVVAVTKVDAVDRERLAVATKAVTDLLAATPYRDAPFVPLSVVSGEGLATLTSTLLALRNEQIRREVAPRFRLAIDRAFTLKGIGLVVTGTALAGRVAVDDELVLLPGGATVRVRGIHAHNEVVTAARAGQRVALNVVGRGVEKSSVARGDWLVAPTIAITTDRLDVVLDGDLDAFDTREWRHVRFHAGAMSCNARIVRLFGEIAQVVFETPAHVVVGDRFVVRDASLADGAASMAGGIVLDVDVPARGRRSEARRAFLEVAARGDSHATLAQAVAASTRGIDVAHWNAAHNTAFDAATFADTQAVATATSITLFARAQWDAMGSRVIDALADEHRRAPDAVGPARDRLRRMATASLDAATFGVLIDALKADGALTQTGAWLHLPTHRVELSGDDRQRFERARPLLAGDRNNPPRIRDLAQALVEDESALRDAFVRVASLGEVYRIAHDHYFLPTAVQELARIVAELAATDGVTRAASFRDRIGAGRKVAIQILEFFDRIGYTRRVGDDHRVIQPTMFDE